MTRKHEPSPSSSERTDRSSAPNSAPELELQRTEDEVSFVDLFDLDEIQEIQDTFANATGVASIITDPNGVPLTKPSNFSRLCKDIIRKTEKGLANCMASDAAVGQPSRDGPIIQPCLSAGLWDGGASISVGDKPIANWLIGQVRNERQSEEEMLEYAREIGADEDQFREALAEVTVMSTERFKQVCRSLYLMANLLSAEAFKNLQLARINEERERGTQELQRAHDEMEQRVLQRTAQLQKANETLQAEIAERKRIEEELRDSRERFALAMLGGNDGLWDWNLEKDEVYFSPRWKGMLGYEEDEIANHYDEWAKRIHPDDLEGTLEAIEAYRQGRTATYEAEFRMRHKEGRYVPILSRGFGVRDTTGKVIRMVGTHVDLTDLKRAEEELRKHRDRLEELVAERTADLRSTNQELLQEIAERKRAEAERERLSAVLEATSDFVSMAALDGRLIYLNSAGKRMLGWPDDVDIREKRIADCSPKEFVDWTMNEWIPIAIREGVWSGESALLSADGIQIPVSQVIMSHKSAEGELEYLSTVMRDITESKLAEEELQLNELRLETLLELNRKTGASLDELTDFALEEGVKLTKSKLGYLAFMNDDETVLTMHAWSGGAMAECEIQDKPLVYPVAETGLWGEAVRQRKPIITNDYRAPNPLKKGYPEGHVHILRHMNVPIFDGPKLVAVAGVGNKEAEYNISDVRQLTLLMEGMWQIIRRHQVEQQREKLLADLEAQNEELERFTYTVSHDLKSPLITIKGYMGLLREDVAAGSMNEVQDDINRVISAADKMERLLSELLELSRIGRIVNPPEEVSLADLVAEAVELVGGQINNRGVEVIVAEAMPVVRGDRPRLLEVVQNLIDNAVKYMGDQRNPRIEVACRESEDFAICCVRDNGVGIAPEFQEKVFGLFEQLSQRNEGSGVGLALVKRIVEIHGGKIWVESEGLGKGATFCFSIPIAKATTEFLEN